MRLIQKYLAPLPGRKVLEMPCGSGMFASMMSDVGLDVTAMDIEANDPYHYLVERRVLADANAGLPFSDNEFEALVSIEGIEHLENPSFFLRECARVIRPGGHVFLSTPNVDSIKSRRHMYYKGYHRFFEPMNSHTKISWHVHPIDMVFFRGACLKAGLKVTEVSVNRMKYRSWFEDLTRPLFTRKLPAEMRGEIPYYGDTIIYVLTK
jgi:SAM-dependent methyltransferase